MRKPFNGDYQMTRGFGGNLIPNDAKYGKHKGVDWALPPGTPLYACVGGSITWASDAQDAGLTVTINSLGSLYKCFHMSEIYVRVGQNVTEGQLIGKSGSTGNVTGPHLHFQVEVPAGNPVDPLPLLNEEDEMYQGKTAKQWAEAAKSATDVAEKRAQGLAAVALASGVNPDHPLEDKDFQQIVKNIDLKNKLIEDLKASPDKAAKLLEALKEALGENV